MTPVSRAECAAVESRTGSVQSFRTFGLGLSGARRFPERRAKLLAQARDNRGRLFFPVGGSAGNCSHAVNDFRKIVGIEAYTPTDNVSELTARTNDEGWETVFIEWLKVSHLRPKDVIFLISVGAEISRRTSVQT